MKTYEEICALLLKKHNEMVDELEKAKEPWFGGAVSALQSFASNELNDRDLLNQMQEYVRKVIPSS